MSKASEWVQVIKTPAPKLQIGNLVCTVDVEGRLSVELDDEKEAQMYFTADQAVRISRWLREVFE